MSIVHIENDLRLSDTQSLVELRIEAAAGAPRHYVAIMAHHRGSPLAFRVVESTSPDTAADVFARRGKHGARTAETCVEPANRVTLGPAGLNLANTLVH